MSSSFVEEKDLLVSEETEAGAELTTCLHNSVVCIPWFWSSVRMHNTSKLEAVYKHNGHFVRSSILQGLPGWAIRL